MLRPATGSRSIFHYRRVNRSRCSARAGSSGFLPDCTSARLKQRVPLENNTGTEGPGRRCRDHEARLHNALARFRSYFRCGSAGEDDFIAAFVAESLAGPHSGWKSRSPSGAADVRGASNPQIARNGVRTAALTRLSPVDWDMDSKQGFILASGAWRGGDVVGRTGFKSQNPARGVFSLCDSGLSMGREVWAR
jgi:hypothetical protein